MANCRGAAGRSDQQSKQELCVFCRTQVCEECYALAVSRRSSALKTEAPQPPTRHPHMCVACARLHPEVTAARSSNVDPRYHSLLRVNSAPSSEQWPRPKVASRAPSSLLARARSSREDGGRALRPQSCRRVHTAVDLELSTVDLRQRRYQGGAEPGSRRGHPSATSSAAKRPPGTSQSVVECTVGLSDDDLRMLDARERRNTLSTAAEPSEYDFRGQNASFDAPKHSFEGPGEMELSTVDLRDPKYKMSVAAPVSRRGKRKGTGANTTTSALKPLTKSDIEALGSKLEAVGLKHGNRNHKDPESLQTESKQPQHPETDGTNVGVFGRMARRHIEPVNFHLSRVDLRPRRYTTDSTPVSPPPMIPEACTQQPQEGDSPSASGVDDLIPIARERNAELVDFHLSKFDLRPRRHTADSASGRQNEHRLLNTQEASTAAATTTIGPEIDAPRYSKATPCDLSYLENFKSYTV